MSEWIVIFIVVCWVVLFIHQFCVSPRVQVFYTDPAAKEFGLPVYQKDGDAGVDLRIILSPKLRKTGLILQPNERKLFDAGFRLQFPKGYYGRITHRSSTEFKRKLRVVEGVLDEGYRGPVYTHVFNTSGQPVLINHGDRLAQLILTRTEQFPFVEVKELEKSDRNDRGFGHTGER